MKCSTIVISIITFSLFTCQKEEFQYDPYLVSTYQQFLEDLVLDCPSDTSEYYFKGIINGYQTCYYDGIDGRILRYGISSKFTTPGPSFNTGDTISDAKRGFHIEFPHYPYRQGEDYIDIAFPDVSANIDKYVYLDSMFAKTNYEVKSGTEDENYTSFITDDKFLITLNMMDKHEDSNGGHVFPISTQFGSQDDSYVRIIKADKTVENGVVYYFIVLEIECNLYHWPQYGKEGLWGKIENGILVAKCKIN